MRLLAPHRPSPVTSARGLPGGLRVFGTALPAPGLLRGGDTLWLLTAPGRASWLQSQLAAAWARSPASLGPRSGCLRPTPQSLDFLFLSPFFSLWWQIWVSFLASFVPSFLFFFLLRREESGGGGVAWRALKKRPGAAATVLRGWNSSARAAAVAAQAAVRCWPSPDKRPSVPGLLAQSAALARLSPAPAARSLLLAVG